MIYYMFCINSQPLCHVINVYINAQMIIFMIIVNINAIFLELLSIMLMLLLLSTESLELKEMGVLPCNM